MAFNAKNRGGPHLTIFEVRGLDSYRQDWNKIVSSNKARAAFWRAFWSLMGPLDGQHWEFPHNGDAKSQINLPLKYVYDAWKKTEELSLQLQLAWPHALRAAEDALGQEEVKRGVYSQADSIARMERWLQWPEPLIAIDTTNPKAQLISFEAGKYVLGEVAKQAAQAVVGAAQTAGQAVGAAATGAIQGAAKQAAKGTIAGNAGVIAAGAGLYLLLKK